MILYLRTAFYLVLLDGRWIAWGSHRVEAFFLCLGRWEFVRWGICGGIVGGDLWWGLGGRIYLFKLFVIFTDERGG